MNRFLTFLVQSVVTVPSAVTVWFLSYFAFDLTFLMSSAISLASGVIVYKITSGVMTSRFLKKQQLTRKEYSYIKKNLDEAKQKINRLNKSLFSIRDLSTLKQRLEVLRITRKIQSMTQAEPKRFYKAEKFYFSHLDSVVELTEKYRFLAQQPKKSHEIDVSLYETRQTLNDLTKALEEDLYHVVEDDLDSLNFEIDVAKHSIKKLNDPKIIDESRRLK
ncbi:5-bromo-4-chloroindolyl phosphate hydrolysis family protein [Bacillus sp. EB106-08-02-XG196]|uniref:5-bromo-4-chloroindolyl phosphate hydrolysis family protein n=1 Tax=Bacillus sp. EB106-08-02-XG196 TaxID=2737049 RepID=UPI0015C46B41|nr:5-bromo-4-chloroindolyl phosphate hydrolysis family protein [Bacillus sp. EB106-08-02-XG196]NWQ39519.1 5-bromo-4-chloroindolyl phosphate hydrolysis family protein [Bacillus sp. EB106-08-02-XG196]